MIRVNYSCWVMIHFLVYWCLGNQSPKCLGGSHSLKCKIIIALSSDGSIPCLWEPLELKRLELEKHKVHIPPSSSLGVMITRAVFISNAWFLDPSIPHIRNTAYGNEFRVCTTTCMMALHSLSPPKWCLSYTFKRLFHFPWKLMTSK